jgi:hypothetical protein
MILKQCLNQGHVALLFFVVLATTGCGSTTYYRATSEDTRDLSPTQARKLLIKSAQTDGWCRDPRTINVTHEKVEVTCAQGTVNKRSFLFSEIPAPVFVFKSVLGGLGEVSSTCVKVSGDDENCMFFWGGGRPSAEARDLVKAWYVLARAAAAYPAQEAAFERAAQSYREAKVKPPLPENAVKFKVQAELAVQQKRFDDAADLYDQALGIAPWWPPGHYNRGLILGEIEDYQGGIRALQKYLTLEPDAANARAVQLKIYQWESLLPQAAK